MHSINSVYIIKGKVIIIKKKKRKKSIGFIVLLCSYNIGVYGTLFLEAASPLSCIVVAYGVL